ncbi:unnamed protein product [Symbiodinium microadriaticum]|nr:unnamed protein product [Symbiodinium microadriaticum]
MYMHSQDWYDLSKHGGVRKLRRDDPAPSPYKPGVASPLRSLASIGSNPLAIHPDPAHTYAINGWGKDLAAGALLTLVHLRVIWDGSIEKSLELAYSYFREFCRATGKSTSIVRFDFKLKQFPGGLGKGHDCAVMLAWLEAYLQNLTVDAVAEIVVESGWKMLEGYDLLAKTAMERKWVLYKYRPKLHMQAHLVSL